MMARDPREHDERCWSCGERPATEAILTLCRDCWIEHRDALEQDEIDARFFAPDADEQAWLERGDEMFRTARLKERS